jgi:hypothetical protein
VEEIVLISIYTTTPSVIAKATKSHSVYHQPLGLQSYSLTSEVLGVQENQVMPNYGLGF